VSFSKKNFRFQRVMMNERVTDDGAVRWDMMVNPEIPQTRNNKQTNKRLTIALLYIRICKTYFTNQQTTMEHFTSVLVAFWFVTFILWKYASLLDAKGRFTVLLSFFGLIHVQRSDVRKEKEQEHADRIKKIEDYQDAQVAKHELFEWWTKESVQREE
jgi:hypothetical protein